MRAEPAGGLTDPGQQRQAISLSLFRFPTLAARHWALWQMLLARPALKRLPGVQFMKMVGSGSREGFFPWPDFGVYGVLAAWPSLDHARAQVNGADVFARYRARSCENVTLYLHAVRSRGAWAGAGPFRTQTEDDPSAPLAVLTRATIHPRRALAFWSRTPAIRATIPDRSALAFQAGLGEVPWLHQITFTVWTDRAALRAFAHDPAGPHGQAAEAARRLGWFREELFARFRVAAVEGRWAGFDAAALTPPVSPRPLAA